MIASDSSMESASESQPELLWQSETLWCVHKPAGWFVHPSPLDPRAPNLLDWIRATTEADAWVVHRLDRPTQGLVLMARSREAASELAEQFRERRIQKTYECVVRGWVADEGEIDRALSEQEARTRYRTLERFELPWAHAGHATTRYSWLEVYPETGRFHQIRRHLAGLSHPLVGDTRYGEGWHNRKFREELGFSGLALRATALALTSGSEIALRAPESSAWTNLLTRLRQTSSCDSDSATGLEG